MINPQITKSTQLVVMVEAGLQREGKPLKVGQLVELTNAEANKYILRGYARQAKINQAQYDEYLIEASAGITTIVEETEPEPDPQPHRKPAKHGK